MDEQLSWLTRKVLAQRIDGVCVSYVAWHVGNSSQCCAANPCDITHLREGDSSFFIEGFFVQQLDQHDPDHFHSMSHMFLSVYQMTHV